MKETRTGSFRKVGKGGKKWNVDDFGGGDHAASMNIRPSEGGFSRKFTQPVA